MNYECDWSQATHWCAYVQTAQAIWEILRKRYAIANEPKIYQLKTHLAACKQGGLEVVEFYSKIMGM